MSASPCRHCAWYILTFAYIYIARAQIDNAITSGTGPPDPRLVGLEQKTVLEQLLARKDYMAEYIKGDAFKRNKEQQQQLFSKPGNGKGILIVAGGRDMFANAAITVLMLRRRLHSTLPIEIVHYGASERPQDVYDILLSFNSTTAYTQNSSSSSSSSIAASDWTPGVLYVTDAMQVAPPHRLGWHHKEVQEVKSFPAKAYALAFVTRFQQVMLLDADSMPLIDPAILFGLPSFRSSGNLFWPDFWHNAWVNASIYNLMAGQHMDKPPWEGNPDHRLVDSGQILFDRLRHADVLEYLWLLNSHHEWVYKHMHGDKDTFLLAFAMAGKLQDFRMVPCFGRDAMVDVPGHKHRYHHLGMVQSVPPGVLAATIARASRVGDTAATMLLQFNKTQPTAAVAPDVSQDSDEESLTAVLPENGRKKALREELKHAGIPVVFHRTSFNSKFFPDCLDKTKTETEYCQVQYVSVPLSSEQAGYSLKPNMYAFNEDQVSTDFYEKRCTEQAAAQTALANATIDTDLVTPGTRKMLSTHITHITHQVLSSQQSYTTAASAVVQQDLPQEKGTTWHVVLQQWLHTLINRAGMTATMRQQHTPPSAATNSKTQRQLLNTISTAANPSHHLKGVQLQRYVLQQLGPPPEWNCESLKAGESELPIPFMKVELFRHMHGVLVHSYEAFREVRERLKV